MAVHAQKALTTRASMVDRWLQSSSSRSPSTAQNPSASLVSGARYWGMPYRRHRKGSPAGTITIVRRRLRIRVQRSHALIPLVWPATVLPARSR